MLGAAKVNCLGIAALIAWILSVVLLVPLPNQTADALTSSYRESTGQKNEARKMEQQDQARNLSSDVDLQTAIQAIWVTWWVKVGFVGTGIAISIWAIYRRRYWRYLLGAVSLVFIAAWVFSYTRAEASFVELYVSFAKVIFDSGSVLNYVSFCVNDVLLPIFNIALVFLLVILRDRDVGNTDARAYLP